MQFRESLSAVGKNEDSMKREAEISRKKKDEGVAVGQETYDILWAPEFNCA